MEEKIIENEEISLKDLINKAKYWYKYLLSKWRIIILAGIVGALFGVAYSAIKKTVYTASLSFALEDDKSGGIGLGSALASSFGLDVGGSGGGIFAGSNLTELFKSRVMVEKTLLSPIVFNGKEISIAELYIQNNKLRENWNKDSLKDIHFLPNADREKFTRIQDSILGTFYDNLAKSDLSVSQKDKKISIITMDVKSQNELFAKIFCEALARQVGEFYIETKSKKARMNMAILEHQVDSIRSELNGAITGVAIANDNTFNLNPALNVRRAPSARRQVDVQANTAILTELVKQAELAKVTLRKETPLIQVIDKPILPLPKQRFGKIKGVFYGGGAAAIFLMLFLIIKKIFKNNS